MFLHSYKNNIILETQSNLLAQKIRIGIGMLFGSRLLLELWSRAVVSDILQFPHLGRNC